MADSKDNNNSESQEVQPPSTLSSDTHNAVNDEPEDDNQSGEDYTVYSHDTIYTSGDASKKLGITYAMVRYWAKQFQVLLPDAKNVEQGTLKLSSYDIDILQQALALKKDFSYSTNQIIAELSASDANPVDRPTILTSENFMKLTQTPGFNEYMKYYTNMMMQTAIERQGDAFQELSAKLDEVLKVVNSSSTLEEGPETNVSSVNDQHDQEFRLEDLEAKLLEEKEKNDLLSQELEKERQKPIWKKLFRID